MNVRTILKVTAAAALLASMMTAPGLTGFAATVSAKEGNGGGHGGGNGGGNGNSGGQGKSDSGKSGRADTGRERGSTARRNNAEKQAAGVETEKPRKAATISPSPSELRGLNSLNRNYRAYINSNEPKMAAVSAYAKAYAEYEAKTGTTPSVTDPALGDEALREALSEFTGRPVDDETLAFGKNVLGVGAANGKIDQLRADLN